MLNSIAHWNYQCTVRIRERSHTHTKFAIAVACSRSSEWMKRQWVMFSRSTVAAAVIIIRYLLVEFFCLCCCSVLIIFLHLQMCSKWKSSSSRTTNKQNKNKNKKLLKEQKNNHGTRNAREKHTRPVQDATVEATTSSRNSVSKQYKQHCKNTMQCTYARVSFQHRQIHERGKQRTQAHYSFISCVHIFWCHCEPVRPSFRSFHHLLVSSQMQGTHVRAQLHTFWFVIMGKFAKTTQKPQSHHP